MIKRLFDFLFALVGMIILSPVFLVISLSIKLTSQGPIFHRGKRVGLNGKVFTLLKFRTMASNTENMWPVITVKNDSRITPFGQILRRTKIDELPQLLNVLKGDMSLVGPRPEDPFYVAQYSFEQREVLKVRPGVTSAASLLYRNEENILIGPDWESKYRSEVLPAKLAIDLAYISRRTLLSDFILIVRTLLYLFK